MFSLTSSSRLRNALQTAAFAFLIVGAFAAVRLVADDDKPKPIVGSPCLEFTGKESCVVIPKLRYIGEHPITLEAIVVADEDAASGTIVGNIELCGVGVEYIGGRWRALFNDDRDESNGYAFATSDKPMKAGTRTHVAGVWDGKQLRIYVDGKQQKRTDTTTKLHKESQHDFMIGADPNRKNLPHKFFKGKIDEVRISKVARYTKDFSPPTEEWKSDADTMALYHFDEGDGKVAKDSSANGYHAEIRGATWSKMAE